MKPSDMIEKKVVDPNAETIAEICAATGKNRCGLQLLANDYVAGGKWERVWKKNGNKLVPAYRVKKK